jgi:Tol biopolymer transport system component/DNA-binding winged helix-turn-helix (wHTH) protein
MKSGEVFQFGEFQIDVLARTLRRENEIVTLNRRAFDVLLYLVKNPGRVLTRDELLKNVWPETFVDENSLAQSISALRRALEEKPGDNSYIVTLPGRGYQFVSVVHVITPETMATVPVAALDGSHAPGGLVLQQQTIRTSVITEEKEQLRLPAPRGRRYLMWIAVGVLAAAATYRLLSTPQVPRVVGSKPLTKSGKVEPWGRIVRDGSRLYFLERDGDHWNVMQTSTSGGPAQKVDVPFHNTIVLDISPDHATLLIASFSFRGDLMPLWIWPVQGGAPRRVGEVLVRAAVWCPNNRQILFSQVDGIYKVDADGSNVKKFLATDDGVAGDFAWSPDGRLLRFTLYSQRNSTIWEANVDGTNPHRLLPGGEIDYQRRGIWNKDGRYFFFQSQHAKSVDVWVLRERDPLRLHSAVPVRLTQGPLNFHDPIGGENGKVFVVGGNGRNEFIDYDLQSHQFHPAYTDLPGTWMNFSRDGQWIAFSGDGDGTIGRMKSDGTQRLDLTPPGIFAVAARWSPDGRRIAFLGITSTGAQRVFLIPADGGSARELFPDNLQQEDLAWSPDGKLFAFCRDQPPHSSGPAFSQIHIFNLETGTVSPVPAPGGMRFPTWSPDGQFIAAVTEDRQQVMLMDVRTHEWAKLSEARLVNNAISWANDGKALYYQDLLAPGQPVYRIRLSDHKRELVVSFEALLAGSTPRAGFVTFAPDGSLIATVGRSGDDIYTLDLDLP